MILVEGRSGASAGCCPHVAEDKPGILLLVNVGRDSLGVLLDGDNARLLAASLTRDCDAVEPLHRLWVAENDSQGQE